MSGEILIKDILRTIGYQLNSTFHLSLRLYTLLNDYSKSCSKAVRPYTVIRVNVHIRRCVVSKAVRPVVGEDVRPSDYPYMFRLSAFHVRTVTWPNSCLTAV